MLYPFELRALGADVIVLDCRLPSTPRASARKPTTCRALSFSPRHFSGMSSGDIVPVISFPRDEVFASHQPRIFPALAAGGAGHRYLPGTVAIGKTEAGIHRPGPACHGFAYPRCGR